MGWAVFTQTDGIVGVHKQGVGFHQRGHAQGIAGVFAEHQESAAEWAHTTVQSHAVHDGAHAKLAHAVMDVVTTVVTGNRY